VKCPVAHILVRRGKVLNHSMSTWFLDTKAMGKLRHMYSLALSHARKAVSQTNDLQYSYMPRADEQERVGETITISKRPVSPVEAATLNILGVGGGKDRELDQLQQIKASVFYIIPTTSYIHYIKFE
jgi:hypothetical protein